MDLHRLVVALACVASLIAVQARGADEPDEDMPGRIVLIRPSSQLFKFISKAATEFALPAASNDPTVEGGSLVVYDGGGAQSDTYSLPASGWKALGTPVQGYKYKGAGSPTDPCRVVLVKKRVAKAVCKGPGVTLTTPFGGDVGIVLTLGTDSKQYCARFGGSETKNDVTLLKRGNAPALPVTCPIPGPTTTTTLAFACDGPGAPCGSCPAGYCATHIHPAPPPNVCTNSAVCSPTFCSSDVDCGSGNLCIENPFPTPPPFPPGPERLCCAGCP
jgi:hypothetical protein